MTYINKNFVQDTLVEYIFPVNSIMTKPDKEF